MKNMIYILLVLFFLGFAINAPAQVTGEFPYFESFRNDKKPDGIKTPTPSNGMVNSVEFEKFGVVLTPNSLDRFGAIYLENHQFTSKAGIFISFEYMISEGDGGDGMTLFFFDATKNPGIGAPGAGIGYTYNRSVNNTQFSKFRSIGLGGAYLGIAFDSYGNFKKMRYQGESRVNGIPYNHPVRGNGVTAGIDGGNDVTLRGAMNPTGMTTPSGSPIPGIGAGYYGYPVLVTQRTTENIGLRLQSSGDHVWERYDQLKAKKPFAIRGGTEFERPTDPGYRKAFVELFPENGGGFSISVMIQTETGRDTIIYDYKYRESFSYRENAITNSSGDNYENDDLLFESPTRTLDATVPKALKIGFAAATGATGMADPRKDRHAMKNLSVILPRSAEAYDDFVDDKYQGTKVTFQPLLNDIGYKGTVSRVQAPCPECIDGETFRFIQNDGKVSPTPYEYTVPNEGKWTYNKSTETVTFEPISTFLGEARVKYDIKGGKIDSNPYASESYRSTPATIGVDIIVNPNPPTQTKIISNKMVTGRFRK